MRITKDNIGDVLCKYSNCSRVIITGVTDKEVHFQNETWGGEKKTDEFNFPGTIDNSELSKESFYMNRQYAEFLDKIQTSCIESQAYSFLYPEKEEFSKEYEKKLAMYEKEKQAFVDKLNEDIIERKPGIFKVFISEFLGLPEGSTAKFNNFLFEKLNNENEVAINGERYSLESAKDLIYSSSPNSEHINNYNKAMKKVAPLGDLMASAEKRSEYISKSRKTIEWAKAHFERNY